MPPRAAKLAVGGKFQPDVFLLPDDFFNLAVLDRFQCRCIDLFLCVLCPRLFQGRGAQQTADMVGPEGRRGAWRHDCFVSSLEQLREAVSLRKRDPAFLATRLSFGLLASFSPKPCPPTRRSCAAWPTARPRQARCLPRWTRS